MGAASNRQVYGTRWGASTRLIQMRSHIWRTLAPAVSGEVLEIGPGLRPTAPLGSYFADIAPEAVAVIAAAGGKTAVYGGGPLPYTDKFFGAVLAFEVLEHVEADRDLLREMVRVLAPGGMLVLSTPLNMNYWSRSDETSAHVRRYELPDLTAKLEGVGLTIERYCYRYGGRNPRTAAGAASAMERFPRTANFLLQELAFPLHAFYQAKFAKPRFRLGQPAEDRRASGIMVISRLGS